eukprot:Selendium_serpulae@DN6281_c0_g1_i8.p1
MINSGTIGASELTKAALEMFETFVQEHLRNLHDRDLSKEGMIDLRRLDPKRFLTNLCDVLRLLANVRPSLACLHNAADFAIADLQASASELISFELVIGKILTSLSAYYCWETEVALQTNQMAADLVSSKKCDPLGILPNSSSVENAVKISCQSDFVPKTNRVLRPSTRSDNMWGHIWNLYNRRCPVGQSPNASVS